MDGISQLNSFNGVWVVVVCGSTMMCVCVCVSLYVNVLLMTMMIDVHDVFPSFFPLPEHRDYVQR